MQTNGIPFPATIQRATAAARGRGKGKGKQVDFTGELTFEQAEREKERERERELEEVAPQRRARAPRKKQAANTASGNTGESERAAAKPKTSGSRKGTRSASKEAPTTEQDQRSPQS